MTNNFSTKVEITNMIKIFVNQIFWERSVWSQSDWPPATYNAWTVESCGKAPVVINQTVIKRGIPNILSSSIIILFYTIISKTNT